MSDLVIQRAVRRNKKARIALLGSSGAGKSYTALRWAFTLAPTGKVAAIDTEHESLSLYANEEVDGKVWEFDTINLSSFSPENYIEAIKKFERAGYEVLIIDSLSHAWAGKDGALEYVDNVSQRDTSGNKFTAWRKGTQLQNEMVETILAAKMHIIVTMRVKMEYIQEKDDRGKTTVRKVGLQPVQRDGLEYEFDLVCDMQEGNNLSVAKTRCSLLNDKFYRKPGAEPMEVLMRWLNSGAPAPAVETPKPAEAEVATAPRWVDDPKMVAAFNRLAATLAVGDAEALVALGVDDIKDYSGTRADAKSALNTYINQRAAEAMPLAEPEEEAAQ